MRRAVEDADAVKTFFGGLPGYDRKRSKFLANPSSTRVFEALESLVEGPSAAGIGDVVFVYFATRIFRRATGGTAAICANARRDFLRFGSDGCVPVSYLRSLPNRSDAAFFFCFDWREPGFDDGFVPRSAPTDDGSATNGNATIEGNLPGVWRSLFAWPDATAPSSEGVLTDALLDALERRRDANVDVCFDKTFLSEIEANLRASGTNRKISLVDGGSPVVLRVGFGSPAPVAPSTPPSVPEVAAPSSPVPSVLPVLPISTAAPSSSIPVAAPPVPPIPFSASSESQPFSDNVPFDVDPEPPVSRVAPPPAPSAAPKTTKKTTPAPIAPATKAPAKLKTTNLPTLQRSDNWIGKQPGDRMEITVVGVKCGFRWCPAGQFTMGSPKTETGRNDDEELRVVRLSQGFWILETPVTQRLWSTTMKTNPSKFKGADLPVESVSWENCKTFIEQLNEKINAKRTNMRLRLPTEAEWEYACRAGTVGPYPGESLDEYGWFFDNSEGAPRPVKGKKANAWGIFDMNGNVWEWCADRYIESLRRAKEADVASENAVCERVFRGGAWNTAAQNCRAARRNKTNQGTAGYYLGFRVVFAQAKRR